MAQKVGRKIVTDGLIYHLDPTNGQKGEEATITAPTQLSGCELWLDASDLETIIGATAEEWKDKSGNLAHAGQGTSANRPTLVKYGWNGLSYLSFDGSNDTMTGALSNSIVDDSIFVVCRTKNSAADAGIFLVSGSASFGHKGITHHNADKIYSYYSSGSIYKYHNMSTYSPHIISRSYADAVATFHVNGSEATVSNGTPADVSAATAYTIANATNECEIDIGEIIVYNRKLSQAELRQVEKYLSLKWKIGLGGRNIKNLAGGGLYASEVLEDDSTGGPIITHNNTLEFRHPEANNSDLRLEANEVTIADNLPWTIEFWIKRNVRGSVRSVYSGIWGNQISGSDHERLQFTASSGEDKLILVDSGNNNSSTAITNSVDVDCLHKWRHVVLTFDGTTDATTAGCINQYVDGDRKGSNNIALPNADSKITIRRIGSRGSLTDADRLEGELGCFRVYNKELTHGEVRQNYNETKSRFQNTKMTFAATDNLVLYLDADSGSSTSYTNGTWYDLSRGGSNNATRDENAGGGLTWTARNPNNIKGMYYDFDGSDDEFVVSDDSSLDITSEITQELWLQADSFNHGGGGNFPTPISKSAGNYRWFINTSGTLISRYASLDDLNATTAISTGIWYHIVLTKDSEGFAWYIDGQLNASDSQSGAITANNDALVIGNWDEGGARAFDGKIAMVRIYNKALSADEVMQNYNYSKHKFVKA